MTEKEIYLKAAKRIALGENTYSCNALDMMCGDSRKYRQVMGFSSQYEFPDLFLLAINELDYSERKNFRVMLLCMMAAACKDV